MKSLAPLLAVSVSLMVGQAVFAQTPSTPTKVTSVEGITEYRLDNGLKVLLFPDNSKPTVTVNVTYLVGSRFESYGETGMAHLLEHMLFKGTSKRNAIMTELSNHGAQFNGTTSFDRTNYFETMTAGASQGGQVTASTLGPSGQQPSSISAAGEDNLAWALDMEADRMVNSRVSRQDLDSEMTVVRNEFERGENNNNRVLEERVLSTMYLWHNYGHSPIGSRSDIERVPIERLQAFYHKYYQPDNAVLVVAGKFDLAKTLDLINTTFGAIPKPTRQLEQPYTEEPVQDGERNVVLRRVGDVQTAIVAYHGPAGSHEDSVPLQVLVGMLVDPPSGRLYKALVESKKAISVGGDHDQMHDPGYAEFDAEVRKDVSLQDVRKIMLDVIEGVAKEPPSKSEVDRIRTKVLKDYDLAFNNSQRVALQLSNWAAMGDWRLMFLDRDRFEKVTPEDVARVARTYLKESNRTVGEFVPTDNIDRAVVPAPPNVSELLKDYKGKAAIEDGEAFDASAANIDARTVRFTLANGMKVALLQKKTRGGSVTATVTLHYGNEKNVFGKGAAAQFAGTMLMRGSAKYTRQELSDELDKLKTQMNANGGDNDATLNVTTVHANLPAALRLAAEVLRHPTFPENEFEQVRQAMLGRLENNRHEPQALAPLALRKHLIRYPKGDPRAVTTLEEDLDDVQKVTLADTKKFYQDFYGAGHGEFVVIGDFDPAEVRKVMETEFGDWKSPAAYALVLRTRDQVPAVDQMIETPDKANAVFMAGFTLPMNEDAPDYPALLFANEMFGGDLKSRLWHRIREKEGYSYGVGSQLAASARSPFAQFMVQATCVPQNILKVEDAFKDELAKLLKDGFMDQEVAEAKKTYLEKRAIARSQDGGLARAIARNLQFDWTMAHDAELDAKIAALTPDQLTAVARKYLVSANISYFKAGDFKKAGITR